MDRKVSRQALGVDRKVRDKVLEWTGNWGRGGEGSGSGDNLSKTDEH